MPSAPKRHCLEPGCPELVDKGRCRAHQTQRYRQIERYRGSSTARGYDVDWRRVRARVLAAEPRCRMCVAAGRDIENGRVSWATEVDHIIPLVQGGARLDRANLQPLCGRCHAEKTAREARG